MANSTPAPPPAAPVKSELEVALRDRLGLDPDVDDTAVLEALDELLTAPPASSEPAAPTLEARTIRHGLFSYDLPDGGQAIAWRGETVDLLPHDVERGKKFDAFTAKVGQLPEPPAASTLPVLSEEASDAEADAWVESGTVQEILDAVHARPEILPAVLAAEQRRKDDARKTLLDALVKLNGGA